VIVGIIPLNMALKFTHAFILSNSIMGEASALLFKSTCSKLSLDRQSSKNNNKESKF